MQIWTSLTNGYTLIAQFGTTLTKLCTWLQIAFKDGEAVYSAHKTMGNVQGTYWSKTVQI